MLDVFMSADTALKASFVAGPVASELEITIKLINIMKRWDTVSREL